MFKGVIAKNSTVVVDYAANQQNEDGVHVLVAMGRVGGSPEDHAETAVPGGFAQVEFVTDLRGSSRGFIRIVVDAAGSGEEGILEVREDGVVLPNSSERVRGDTTWTYTVR